MTTWLACIGLLVVWVIVFESSAEPGARKSLLIFGLIVAPVLHLAGLVLGFVGAYERAARLGPNAVLRAD